jgi:FkbM family methyltransferase
MSLTAWLAPRLAAPARLEPFPQWTLGAGEKGFGPKLRRSLWRRLREPMVVPWIENLRLNIEPNSETSRSLFITGRYEPNEFCVLDRVLKPGMTFVDVGANVGLYSVFASRKVSPQGTVLAVEASSRECAQLRRNVELNALANINVVKTAVTDRTGETDLMVAPAPHGGHNTLGGFAYGTPVERKERVTAARLDDIIREQRVVRVDVIKMDIEGAEFAALHGAEQTLRRFQPLLLLEISDRSLQHQNANSAQLLDYVMSFGYGLYAFDPQTGLPMPAERKPYYDSENVLAVAGSEVPW